jgi:hypothetical protein
MPDILHTLLKGVVENLVNWLQGSISRSVKGPLSKQPRDPQSILDTGWVQQLDHRFSQVPDFPGLKKFSHFSAVSQWQGVESKALTRQVIAVIAPFLTQSDKAAMHCARAILDFVLISQYRSHDDTTIEYLEHALYRLNKLKRAFEANRPMTKDTTEAHFNYPKFHALTHFPEYIKSYGSIDAYSTSPFEHLHRVLVKTYYNRTNKRADFLKQICDHNIRRTALLAMESLLLQAQTRRQTNAEIRDTIHLTRPTRELHLVKDAQWSLSPADWALSRFNGRRQTLHLRKNYWCRASTMAFELGLDDFIPALAAFVQDRRNRVDQIFDEDQLDKRQKDTSWVEVLPVSLHPSIVCWKRDGRDSQNTEKLVSELVRCKPKWQNEQGIWRRDHVWVCEHADAIEEEAGQPRRNNLVGRLLAIVTVHDPERRDEDGEPQRYSGAFIDILRHRNKGRPHDVHGLIEVEPIPPSGAENPRKLGSRRFYEISTIQRSAHLVAARLTSAEKQFFYINSYIDWDQYNVLFDQHFYDIGKRTADRLAKEHQWVT